MDQSTKPNFTFINLNHPNDLKDQETIDHIRCSAMTNFGRMRRKRKPKREKNQIVFEVRPPQKVMSGPMALSRVGLETIDPFASCPFNLDAYSSRICANIFDTNCGHSIAIRQAWSAVGFRDELSFQTVLTCSALYGEMLRSGLLLTEDTTESLQLYHKALEMISKKLTDPDEHTSDSVIGSMSGFLTHDYIISDFGGWNKHMDGLVKMIRLRGGIETLTTEQLHITLSWVDLCGSFSQDIPPHFPLPASWLHTISPYLGTESYIVDLTNPIAIKWKQEFPESLACITILDKTLSLAEDPNTQWNTWMEPIIYHLLSLRPIHTDKPPSRVSVIEEVCRLGILLALAPVWRTFGIHPVRTTAIRRNLLTILTKYFAEWGQLRSVLLWVLMHATREAETETERNEFGMRMTMVMAKMGVAGWDGLVFAMKDVVRCEGSYEQGAMWDGVKEILSSMMPASDLYRGSFLTTPEAERRASSPASASSGYFPPVSTAQVLSSMRPERSVRGSESE